MRRLLLIRHGQASFKAADYDCLSQTGEEQSRRLGAWLAECDDTPDLIAIGPRKRHRQTAERCLASAGIELPLLTLDGLDEVDHEELLGRARPDLADASALRAELKQSDDPYRAFQDLFVTAVARWIDGSHDSDYTLPWLRFRSNVLDALQTLNAHGAKTIWAFTSGGPIATICNDVLQAPIAQTFTLSWSIVNTSLTTLRLSKRGPQLVTYNAWPHLQQRGDHHLVTLR